MGKNLYLYDKRIKQIQIANTDDLVYIPEDDFNKVYLNHKEDIDKNYGTIQLDENDKAIYTPFYTNMLVHKRMYYFTEFPGDTPPEVDDNFDVVRLTVAEYRKYDELRAQVTDGTTQVMYFDGKFNVVKIPVGQRFDFETKQVVRDVDGEIQSLMYQLTKDNISYNVKYNGFPFEVAGKKYLQPFRGYEDRSYYIDLRNNIEPKNRQVKFYLDKDGVRDSSSFDLVVGEQVSDAFLDGMIIKIVEYENSLKTAVEKYFKKIEEARDTKNIDELLNLAKNSQHNIIKLIDEEIANSKL